MTAVQAPEAGDPTAGLRPRGPVMRFLHGYRMASNKMSGVLGVISASLVFVTVLVSVVNVILRRLGAEIGRTLTSNAYVEAQWYLFTMVFVTGLAYILRDGVNVRVDFWFGNRSARTKSWIDLIGHLIGLLPFAYIGIKYSWPAVQTSWELNEQSPDAGGLPRAPIKTVLMFGFVFIMIQGLAEVIKVVEELRGHELREDSEAPALAGGQETNVEDFDLEVAAEVLAGAGTTVGGATEDEE